MHRYLFLASLFLATPALASECEICVHLWHPKEAIQIENINNFAMSMARNGLYGQPSNIITIGGNHAIQGHAMVSVPRNKSCDVDIKQKVFGKGSKGENTGRVWGDLIKAFLPKGWGHPLIAKSKTGTRAIPIGGLKGVMETTDTAKYDKRYKFLKDRLFVDQTTCFPVDRDTATKFLTWANKAGSKEMAKDPINGKRYRFQRACTDWAHKALEIAGIIEPDQLYTNAYVNEDYFYGKRQKADEKSPVWKLEHAKGPYNVEVKFLTPRIMGKKLKAIKKAAY
jgi:hypothetical protein